VFQLELPEGWMIHNMFNEDVENPSLKNSTWSQPPPPDIVNEEEEYKVEEVRNHRK